MLLNYGTSNYYLSCSKDSSSNLPIMFAVVELSVEHVND